MTSQERLEALLGKAFAQGLGMDANALIAGHREEREALSYEAAVPAEGAWEALAGSVLPRLVYFLDCRGVKLPRASGVFVSLFVGERLYLLEVEDVVQALVEGTGLSPAEMVKRWGADAAPPQ